MQRVTRYVFLHLFLDSDVEVTSPSYLAPQPCRVTRPNSSTEAEVGVRLPLIHSTRSSLVNIELLAIGISTCGNKREQHRVR